ncbi:MAG: HlyD family efflux transporter periplasmic adaptor subunit [Sphingomonas sp.]|jgi:membrane fusion protein|uniref:HlyD family secretion protein n=1 Tax=Sphingomonas sp. TaxID=28214 RepID=UPI0035674763
MFRTEVVTARTERLTGSISIAIPIRWQVFGYFLAVVIVAVTAFLFTASYARVATVTGSISPDTGVAAIQPSRSGTITALFIREGQNVRANDRLVVIRSEEDASNGASPGDRVAAAIADQDINLVARDSASRMALSAQIGQFRAQKAGLEEEIAALGSQISLQHELIASAQQELDRLRPVAERGFINGSEYRARQENLVSRRQQLAQLEQSRSSRRASAMEVDRSIAGAVAQARAQAADIGASRAQLAQQAANAAGARSYALRSPVDGRVTAVTARRGQIAQPGSSLLSIIPASSHLRVELAVPSSAIGFVKPGQSVRLAIDAFPYQRFGVVPGRIVSVAGSPVSKTNDTGLVVPLYTVTVEPERQTIAAYGRDEPLLPGMTVSARIITQRQSLIEWLFEPLFAVQRR